MPFLGAAHGIMGCTQSVWRIRLKIKRIEHVSINVSDMQTSLDFYGRILGFHRLQTVDCGDFDIAYFQLPDGSRLELFDYRGNNQSIRHEESDSGLRHLAFLVDDVHAYETYLRNHQVPITLPTTDLSNLSARVLLFLDPNGVTLEFCELL